MKERWLANVLAISGIATAISACSVENRDFGVNGNGALSTGGTGAQDASTSTGGSGKQDSGTSYDAGNSDAIKPNIVVKPDLVGFATQLDGSGSTGPTGESLTYEWSILSFTCGKRRDNLVARLGKRGEPDIRARSGR